MCLNPRRKKDLKSQETEKTRTFATVSPTNLQLLLGICGKQTHLAAAAPRTVAVSRKRE
jgi:hypothetical protein